jgi:hypothetical protein
MILSISTLTQQIFEIDIDITDTIETLKFFIYTVSGKCPDEQRLIYKGKQLEDNQTIHDYNIQKGDMIHMVYRLRGGMYHETSGKNGAFSNTSSLVVSLDGDENSDGTEDKYDIDTDENSDENSDENNDDTENKDDNNSNKNKL